jgi:Cu(I)/Ag(I) efflux system membrane fusion protein
MLNWRLSVLLLTLVLGACACPMHRANPAQATPNAGAQAPSQASYTCPMHPQVVKPAPGQCPICGMDLVLKKN